MKELFKNNKSRINLINILSLFFITLIFISRITNPIYSYLSLIIVAILYIVYQRQLLINKFYLIFLCFVTIYIIASYLNLFNRNELIFEKEYILRQSIVFFMPIFFVNILKDINSNIFKNYKFYFLIYIVFLIFFVFLQLLIFKDISFAFLNGSLSMSIIGLVLINYNINLNVHLNKTPIKYIISFLLIVSCFLFAGTTQSLFFFLTLILLFVCEKKYSSTIVNSIFMLYLILFVYSILILTINSDYNYSSVLIRARFFFNDLQMILNSNLLGNGLGTYNIYINYDAPIRSIFDRPNIYDLFLVNSHNMFTHIFQKFGILSFIFFCLFFFYDLKPKINALNIKIDYTLWVILILSISINPSYFAAGNVMGLYFLIAALSNEKNLLKIKF